MAPDDLSPRAAFLGQFQPELVPFFLQFCEKISSLSSDVVMFTARKAVCLFDAARELGLLKTQGQVTSDRVLDMDLEWLRDKSVTIVDDVLITGSSLHRAISVLREAGCAHIDVLALAVDSDYWLPDLVTPTAPYLQLDNRRALMLCTQIVEAISVVPRPYNVDWPQLRCRSRAADRARGLSLGLGDWSAREVTSDLQRRYAIENITYTPPEHVMGTIEAALGIPRNLMTLSKVRAYFRPRTDSDAWDVTATPIIHFDVLDGFTVDRIFKMTCGAEGVSSQFISRSSRLRAIQYWASSMLGLVWRETVTGTVLASMPSEDMSAVCCIVPPMSIGCLVNATGTVDSRPVVGNTVAAHDRASSPPLAGPFSQGYSTQSELQEALTEPFLDLYMSKEIPAREILRKEGIAAFENPEYRGIINRLSKGYTARQLEQILHERHADNWCQQTLSTYLDIALDHGMVVPITQSQGDLVRRAFRHGEDIVFGLQEKRLFSLVLTAAASESPKGSLRRRDVEKICVLFLRVGLQRKILNQWYGRLGKANTAGIRWHLKGALVQVESESLFGANLDRGITDLLARDGIICAHRNGLYSVSPFDDRAPTSDLAEGTAEVFGLIMGRLLHSNAEPSLSGDEITLLASCDSILSLAGALAAEVNIVRAAWETHRFRLVRRRVDSVEQIEKMLRKSDMFEAAHSGSWKYSRTMSGQPKQIIERIARELKDPVAQREWRMCWGNLVDSGDTDTPQLRGLVDNMGRWLYSATATLDVIRAVLRHEIGEPAKAIESSLRSASEWARAQAERKKSESSDLTRFVDRSIRILQVGDAVGTESVIHEALERMDRLGDWAPGILDQVRLLTMSLREAPTLLSYDSALVVSFDGEPSDKDAFHAIVSTAFLRAKRASMGRGYRIDEANQLAGCTADHVFVARGDHGASVLRRLGETIIASRVQGSLRLFLIPTLSERQQVYGTDSATVFYGDGFVDLAQFLLESRQTGTLSRFYVVTRESLDQRRRLSIGLGYLGSDQRYIQTTSFEELNLSIIPRVSPVRADIGIVTIISEETRAVADWLEKCPRYQRRVRDDGTVFRSADIDLGEMAVTVVHTQALDQGQTSALIALQQLQRDYEIRFSVLLGIGGSVHPDVQLGDVVFGNQVIDYGPQALTSAGPKHRGEAFPAPAKVKRLINDFFACGDDPRHLDACQDAIEMGKTSFTLVRGPVGTGYAVVKFRDSEVRQWIETFNEKTLVVETEGEAAARHFYESGETYGSIGYFILRGVSDHADEKKNDRWKLATSRNAVLALRELLPVVVEAIGLGNEWDYPTGVGEV